MCVIEVSTHAELNGSVRGPRCAATAAFSWKASLLGLQLFNALIYTSKHSAKGIVLLGWWRGEGMGVMRGAFIPFSLLFLFLLSRGLGGCWRSDKLRWGIGKPSHNDCFFIRHMAVTPFDQTRQAH